MGRHGKAVVCSSTGRSHNKACCERLDKLASGIAARNCPKGSKATPFIHEFSGDRNTVEVSPVTTFQRRTEPSKEHEAKVNLGFMNGCQEMSQISAPCPLSNHFRRHGSDPVPVANLGSCHQTRIVPSVSPEATYDASVDHRTQLTRDKCSAIVAKHLQFP
mmetsp:Transcript_15382/g.24458  ORF Transcript_15382/g.24458 Transcript_15382/m.24458 type:complete len:161 (+) Transcript_15382:420-902(+)